MPKKPDAVEEVTPAALPLKSKREDVAEAKLMTFVNWVLLATFELSVEPLTYWLVGVPFGGLAFSALLTTNVMVREVMFRLLLL